MTTPGDDRPAVLIPADAIGRRVAELGAEISADFPQTSNARQGDELVMLVIMKGAFMFVADLARALSIPVIVDFLNASSYGSARVSSGEVAIEPAPWPYGEGRRVLIVEDVLDTGRTLETVAAYISTLRPKSVKTVALLRKPGAAFALDYVGFDIESRFVVGYGLDDAGSWRQLPYIGVMAAGAKAGLDV